MLHAAQYNAVVSITHAGRPFHSAVPAADDARPDAAADIVFQAIKDCDKAIHLTPDNPVTLESRAMTRLRMGDFDRAITDYNASLKLQPKSALALYGRGLAESHKPKTAAAGEGDMAAATALAPHIAEEFKRRGVIP